MMEAVMSLSQPTATMALQDGDPRPGETMLTGKQPCYDVYETADERYVTLAALEPKFWETFCKKIDREHLIEHHMAQDQAIRKNVREEVAKVFAKKTQAEWEEELGEEEVMIGMVRTPKEMLEDPHVRARDTVKKTDGTLNRIDYPAKTTVGLDQTDEKIPELGEHTEAVLRDHGYTDEEIQTLRQNGTI